MRDFYNYLFKFVLPTKILQNFANIEYEQKLYILLNTIFQSSCCVIRNVLHPIIYVIFFYRGENNDSIK